MGFFSNIFNFFNSLYRKLKWLINFVKVYLGPIYDELVKISKEIKATDLKDDEARRAVFQKITDFMQANSIKISDSILNLCIEITYQLIKNNKE